MFCRERKEKMSGKELVKAAERNDQERILGLLDDFNVDVYFVSTLCLASIFSVLSVETGWIHSFYGSF